MQRRFGLREQARFDQIHQQGRSFANRLLALRILPNELVWNRFAFLVSKRIGKAVVRNQVKRRLREIVRLASLKPGWDIIFIARRGVEAASYPVLQESAAQLLRRAHLIAERDSAENVDSPTQTVP